MIIERIHAFRLGLAACAGILLVWGIRTDSTAYRWAGIGCLVIVLILRFVRQKPPLD